MWQEDSGGNVCLPCGSGVETLHQARVTKIIKIL